MTVIISPLGSTADSIKPTMAATKAFTQGQAYERLFQDIYLAPGTCGIVLERARCSLDLQLIASVRGPDPTDVLAQKWFASGDIALRIAKWNASYVPDYTWSHDPVFAWWYTAGIVSIAASIPQGPGTKEYLESLADSLAKHSAAAPDSSAKWVPVGSTPFERVASVQRSLEEVFPVIPYPSATFSQRPVADVQLGVYVSTLQQLVDNPPAFSRPESRAFAIIVLARLQELHIKYADGLTAQSLQAAALQPVVADRESMDVTWRQRLAHSINTKWPEGPRKAFVFGTLIAQIAFNAAVFKDSKADSSFRGVIARLPVWAGITAKTRADIAALQSVPSVAEGGRWQDINAAATAVTLDIANQK